MGVGHAPSGWVGFMPPHGVSKHSSGKLHAGASRSPPSLMIHDSMPLCKVSLWSAGSPTWKANLARWCMDLELCTIVLGGKPHTKALSQVGSCLPTHVAFSWSVGTPHRGMKPFWSKGTWLSVHAPLGQAGPPCGPSTTPAQCCKWRHRTHPT